MKKWLCICVLCVQFCFSQKEANIWYFGENAGLDFNSGLPVALTDGKNSQNNFYGTASIADSNGNLLFYCDGATVWNKNHQVMQNGTNINYMPYYLMLVNPLIVPKPGDSNIYYLFTSGDDDGLRYSEIDMSLNNGLGAVTSSKRISILPFTGGSISGVHHNNGKDIWVVTHDSLNFYSVLVTANGVNTSPIISQPVTNLTSLGRGSIKLAPNGKKLIANITDYNNAFLLDFNNSNGTISNPINLNTSSVFNGEFSPTSNFLYIAAHETIYQFNLNAPDIAGSKYNIHNTQITHFLQLGPDNMIYCGAVDYWDSLDYDLYLSVINDPDEPGSGCNYIGNSIYLKGKKAGVFPQFIQSYFYVGIQTENICFGESTHFHFNSSKTYDSLLWDFGDGNTSTDEEPLHTYTSSGDYKVTLTVTSGLITTKDTKTITIYESPMVSPSIELKQCDDDLDGFSPFNLDEAIDKIVPNLNNETVTFYETESDANSGTAIITNILTYRNKTVSSDLVWARIENENNCYKTSQVKLTVSTTQIPDTFIREFKACDDVKEGNLEDGISTFDFSSVHSEIEALFPLGQELVINYYQNLANALAEMDPIADISNYRNIGYPNMQQIYVRVDSKIDNDCIGLGAHINLHVEPLPEFTIESPQIVCSSDPTFNVILDPIENNLLDMFNYEWVYENSTVLSNEPALTVSKPGTYSITLTRTDGASCSRTREIFVNASELATITLDDITIVDVSNNNTVTINSNNLGLGDYEFALDDAFSSYRDEPIFENVNSGIHTLYVRDKKGCGTSSIDISIIGFPKFFTPNGDGNNDTWQIKGINSQFQTGSDIFIYDRYGKLLKQLATTSNGWDGTFNGTLLASDDYWFSVYLQDGREFKGHFTLKL